MIRRAVPGDVDVLVELIRDLAEYERSAESVQIDHDMLATALFAGRPSVFAHVAETEGRVVGMAIWFLNFSTWTGRHGIYLEDLFIRPEMRGQGIGRSLLRELALMAERSGYARMNWSVLRWNEPALGLYRSIGGSPADEWIGYVLDGPALSALARTDPAP